MEPGPSTVRANKTLSEVAERLQKGDLDAAIVTTPRGKLIGVVGRAEVERAAAPWKNRLGKRMRDQAGLSANELPSGAGIDICMTPHAPRLRPELHTQQARSACRLVGAVPTAEPTPGLPAHALRRDRPAPG